MRSAPERITLSRAKGWRIPENTVKVDRSTRFGNPFPVAKGTSTSCGVTKVTWQVGTWTGPAMWFRDTKEDALKLSVEAFASWLTRPSNAELAQKVKDNLRGKNLACWCKEGPCPAGRAFAAQWAKPQAKKDE